MTRMIEIAAAQIDLAELIEAAKNGDEVVITRDHLPVAKLVAVPGEKPRPRPKFGSAKGEFVMADDFDAPLEDFKEYM